MILRHRYRKLQNSKGLKRKLNPRPRTRIRANCRQAYYFSNTTITFIVISQELLTSEENTKNLERVETKVESEDEDLSTDSDQHASDIKDNTNPTLIPGNRRLTPLGRPPLAPLSRLDKKLSELRISPLRRSTESPISPKPVLVRNISDRDILSRPTFERPKMLFKQQSEIIDLKMHVLTSPEEENFSPLLASAKIEKGLPLTGMFLNCFSSSINIFWGKLERVHNLDSV